VVRVEADAVRAIRVSDGDHAFRARREGAPPRWSIVDEPGGTSIPGSEAKVADLLDRLRWLRAERFGGSGPSPDARVVELEGAEGTLGKIELDRAPYDAPAESGAPAGKLLRLRSSWRPGVALSVAAERVGALPQRAADLGEDAPAPATPVTKP